MDKLTLVVYANTYTNANGCDSVVTLDLIINNSDNTSVVSQRMMSSLWDGQTTLKLVEYTNTYANTNSCDSTHAANLAINNRWIFFEDVSACNCEWNGTTCTRKWNILILN